MAETKISITTATAVSNSACPMCATMASQVEKISQQIQQAIQTGTTITNETILPICISAMQVAEKIPSVTGPQKKSLVLQALNNAVQNTNSDPSLLSVVPSFIDASVSLAKGTLTIDQVEEVATGCCLGFCSMLARNQAKKRPVSQK